MESLPPGNEVVGGQNRPSRQAEPDEPQDTAPGWSNMVSGTFESCYGINNRIMQTRTWSSLEGVNRSVGIIADTDVLAAAKRDLLLFWANAP